MPDTDTRRSFLRQTAVAVTLAGAAAADDKPPRHFICVTCGTQFAATAAPPSECPICVDPRQYVGRDGQQWTTLDELRRTHKNQFADEEPNLQSVIPQPKAGIGQRAFVVRTTAGNLLWDCVPAIDDATVNRIRESGGLKAIAVSHPHFYTSMVEWSRAFGDVPIYIHRDESQWVMRPDPAVTIWDGDAKPLFGGLTLIRTGGHFPGFQVLHWPAGAGGRGVIFAGDQPYVCQDRRWVSFMWSYPNLVPLGPAEIRRIVKALGPWQYDRLYGGFAGQLVAADAKEVVRRSAERYLTRIT